MEINRFDPIETVGPDGDGVGMERNPDGEFVLATDYAALAAERDEWKRRCEAMVALVNPGDVEPQASNNKIVYHTLRGLHTELAAIAEGRDNG